MTRAPGDLPNPRAFGLKVAHQRDPRIAIVRARRPRIDTTQEGTRSARPTRWRRGGRPHLGDDGDRGAQKASGIVEQAELMHGLRPDPGNDLGVQRRAVGDDLRGHDPGLAQPPEECLHSGLLDGALNELVADEAIPIERAGIDGEQ